MIKLFDTMEVSPYNEDELKVKTFFVPFLSKFNFEIRFNPHNIRSQGVVCL